MPASATILESAAASLARNPRNSPARSAGSKSAACAWYASILPRSDAASVTALATLLLAGLTGRVILPALATRYSTNFSLIAASSLARRRDTCWRVPSVGSGSTRPDRQRYSCPCSPRDFELAIIGPPQVPQRKMPDSRCTAGRPTVVRRDGCSSSAFTATNVSSSTMAGKASALSSPFASLAVMRPTILPL